MAGLSALADIAEIAGLLVVVGGIMFALVQLREFRRQRAEATTMALLHSIHGSPELMRALRRIAALPDGVTARELAAMGPDVEDAAHLVCAAYENLGILVYRRGLRLEPADEYFGGSARLCFARLRDYIEAGRRTNPKHFEWFQWLVERLQERAPIERVVGAYERHRRWRP